MPIETTFRNIIALQSDLADLLRDVHDLRIHGRPTLSSLTEAPLLEDWSAAATFVPCLAGRVTGHPLLGSRPRIRTSQLVAFDIEQGWARTWSRYYRLGHDAIIDPQGRYPSPDVLH